LLAHTAVDLGNTGPDYQFGYGSVRIVDAIDHMRTGRFLEDTITQSSTVQYTVSVSPGTSVLKLTMAWDDAPGTLNVNPALVNDLDLVVYAPNGARHYPWTLNPASPGAAAVRVQADHTNNIEQVLVNNPMAGEWRVEVLGYDVPEGPQPFSLTSSHALTGAGLRIRLFVVPSDFAPGVGASFLVRIEELSDTLVGGSPTLHVRYDGGAFIAQPLVPLSGEVYEATLPGPVCGATPEFYISAAG